MLQAMRKHARYFYVLFFIVILSFVFWGVGTVDQSTAVTVAQIDKEKITIEEYWSAYERTRQFYRELLKERFDEAAEKQMNLRQKVLDSLIDERVLLIAAQRAGIRISDQELQDAIINDPLFSREGKFNKDIYVRTLQLNRMTPESFEALKRKELTFAKMRRMIGEAVDLAEADLKMPAGDGQAESLRQAMLTDKRDKALKSYVEGLKKVMKITVNQQLIG